MKKRYLECGKLVSTHALLGEMKLQPWSDSAEFLLDFKTLYLKNGEEALEVVSARVHKGMLLVKFKGYEDINKAQTLRGSVVYIDREDDHLAEGDYYIQDLIGLDVYDIDNGKLYGKLVDVSETGANDVYHIEFGNGKIQLIPAIPQVVLEIDLDNNKMAIRPLEGLFDDEA